MQFGAEPHRLCIFLLSRGNSKQMNGQSMFVQLKFSKFVQTRRKQTQVSFSLCP